MMPTYDRELENEINRSYAKKTGKAISYIADPRAVKTVNEDEPSHGEYIEEENIPKTKVIK